MIDWMGVAANSLWLLGLAILLAILSYADWQAHQAGRRLREVLSRPALQFALWSGLTLFCIGAATSGGRWWERILWGALAVMAALKAWRAAPVRSA
jgi:hypothetical protein